MDEKDGIIKACIGNYGSYNAGYLIDEWIDLPVEPEELDGFLKNLRKKAETLTGEVCEEFYVSDYDGYPLDGGWKSWGDLFGEHTSVYDLNLMAAQLSTMSEHEVEAAAVYIGNQGSRTTMDEAMNVLLQADEVPFYDYGWGEYQGSDPYYQAIHDSATEELKYGYLCIEGNEKLKELLESDSAIDSAFDYEKYGKLCADLDGVLLHENGYLLNGDIDMNFYEHGEITQEVTKNLEFENSPLAEGFRELVVKEQEREVWRELEIGKGFYNPKEERVFARLSDGHAEAPNYVIYQNPEFAAYAIAENVKVEDAMKAAAEGKDLKEIVPSHTWTTVERAEAVEIVNEIATQTAAGWYWTQPDVLGRALKATGGPTADTSRGLATPGPNRAEAQEGPRAEQRAAQVSAAALAGKDLGKQRGQVR